MKSKSADKIFIHQLRVPVIVGVLPEERQKTQEILVDVEIRCSLHVAAERDDIGETVDYMQVCHLIIAFARRSSFQLLETLGDRLIAHLHRHFTFETVCLRLTKQPDSTLNIGGVGIVLERDFR